MTLVANTTEQPPPRFLAAHGIVVREKRRTMLPTTSLTVRTGQLVVATGDPGHGHTALALALCGRLVPDEGTVAIDGDEELSALRAGVTPVDVPGVSEPDDAVPARTIVGEELAMAGQKAGRNQVRTWMDANGLAHAHDRRMEDLEPVERVAMLARLAALRGSPFLVVTMPERHGGLPGQSLPALEYLAATGRGIVVTMSTSALAYLPPAIRTVAFGVPEEQQ